jgi:hypothetical protein
VVGLEVKQVSQETSAPTLFIISILIPISVTVVLRVASLPLNNLVKLTPVEPDSAAGRAKVDLDATSIRNV